MSILSRSKAHLVPAYAQPPLPKPLVWRNQHPIVWGIIFLVTLAGGLIAAQVVSGAYSGAYDLLTQVFGWTKVHWDSLLPSGPRHVARDGGIFAFAVLSYGVIKYNRYNYLYKPMSKFDKLEHRLHIPNVKYRLQQGIKLTKWQMILLPLMVFGYLAVLGFSTFALYTLLRHVFPALPPLAIPAVNTHANPAPAQKFASLLQNDWKIYLVFYPAVMLSMRPLRDVYAAIQEWLADSSIGVRCARLHRKGRPLTKLKVSAPWYWLLPTWRAYYRDMAEQVCGAQLAVPKPMSRKARVRLFLFFIVLFVLAGFGHYWLLEFPNVIHYGYTIAG